MGCPRRGDPRTRGAEEAELRIHPRSGSLRQEEAELRILPCQGTALEWKLQRNKEKEEVSKKASKKVQIPVVAKRETPGDVGNIRREVAALQGAITTLTEQLKEVNRGLIVAIGNN